jgi:hypothetical protein
LANGLACCYSFFVRALPVSIGSKHVTLGLKGIITKLLVGRMIIDVVHTSLHNPSSIRLGELFTIGNLNTIKMNREFIAKALGVSTSELEKGEATFFYLTEINQDTLSSTDYVNLIADLPLDEKVKIFTMHKLTAWLQENTLVIGSHQKEN